MSAADPDPAGALEALLAAEEDQDPAPRRTRGGPMTVLPDAPDPQGWSIVTLAEWLCVPPSAVDALLVPDEDQLFESPDFTGVRSGFSYRDVKGTSLGDCWLTGEAAERIAAALPAGPIARQIVAGRELDEVRTSLAAHLVEHWGGAA